MTPIKNVKIITDIVNNYELVNLIAINNEDVQIHHQIEYQGHLVNSVAFLCIYDITNIQIEMEDGSLINFNRC